MLNEIKKIAAEQGQTFGQVASLCGVSRFTLRRIALKQLPGSVEFWDAIIEWSGGRITPDSRFADHIEAARSRSSVNQDDAA